MGGWGGDFFVLVPGEPRVVLFISAGVWLVLFCG